MTAVKAFFRHSPCACVVIYILALFLFPPSRGLDTLLISAACAMGEPSQHLIYVGYIDSYMLMGLRALFPRIEWFSVLLSVVDCISVFLFARYVIKPRGEHVTPKNYLAFIAYIIYLKYDFTYGYYAFTCCAAMVAGVIAMFHTQGKRVWLKWLGYGVFFVVGASIRYDSCILMIPFLVAIALFSLLSKDKRKAAVSTSAAVVVAVIHLVQPLFANTQIWQEGTAEQNLILFNNARMKFCDYPDVHDSAKEELYRQAGLSENDKVLLGSFLLCHDKRSEPMWLEKLARIRDIDNERIPKSLERVAERLHYPDTLSFLWERFIIPHCRCIILLPLMLLFPLPKSCRDPRLGILAVAYAEFFLLILGGRFHIQSVYTVGIAGFAFMIDNYEYNLDSPRKCAIANFLGTAAALCTLAMFWIKLSPQYSPFADRYAFPEVREKIQEECLSHVDFQYFTSSINWAEIILPANTYSVEPYRDIPNLIYFGGWSTMYPSYQQLLKSKGVSDSRFTASPNVRFIAADSFPHIFAAYLRYMEEHYQEKCQLIREREISSGLYLWRVERFN